MPKILIADDHAIVRYGLKRLLQDLPDAVQFGEAETGDQILALLRAERWDILLLDIEMPGQDAIDMLKHVKRLYQETAVLVLSMYPENQFAMRMLQAGAAGYLSKQLAPDHLLTAVRRVGDGGAYLSPAMTTQIARQFRARPRETLDELLTNREFSVLRGIAVGKSVSAIAKELNLSVKTVSTYRTRLLSKLEMRNNIELAQFAAERNLCTTSVCWPRSDVSNAASAADYPSRHW